MHLNYQKAEPSIKLKTHTDSTGVCSPHLSLKLELQSQSMAASIAVTANYVLQPPPYALDALEPHMSKQTLEFHWGKHHRAYVDNLKKQVLGTDLEGKPLDHIINKTYNNGDLLPAFNNAAQAWNHEFFWESMKPNGGGKPSGELLALLERDFTSYEKFYEEFNAAAATQFGAGWAWLAYANDKLKVVKTPNAVNPLVLGSFPLLTIDVWEHAYYLDFQNRRPDYIKTFMNNLVSWEAVSARLEAAKVASSSSA
ncbi:PREDICTED: superoxide dismutase [Fe] 1, chloroplastic-like isoform X1 [Camelina sativa]|uniref:Superoxide dismutase n=2 Tax=Camelina sativa TaxID=90675 RepID=A0ABM0UZ91_CAMSA|nr:PREDICTED: superoxide dismutase [Fe] 1, chloroplastic-like isoform X1 [Camelina sativa]